MPFKKILTAGAMLLFMASADARAIVSGQPDVISTPENPPLAEAALALQGLTLMGLHANAALYTALKKLDNRCDALDLAVVGHSLKGQPLYRAVVGDSPRTLMVVTQQHGDEPLGTEAALQFLTLLCGDSDIAQRLREAITVVVMPRVNPDGWDRWQQRLRGEETLDPRHNAANMDLNRAYDPSDRPDKALVPEAITLLDVVEQYRPDLLLDYHQQSNYLGGDGEIDTLSVRWATHPDVETKMTEVGQQAAVAVAEGLSHLEHAEVSLYPGSDNPATGRNGLALRGTPTLLIEQRGLQEMSHLAQEGPGRKRYGALAGSVAFEGLLSMLVLAQAMADGTFSQVDPSMALHIAERGEAVDYDEVYADSDSRTKESSAE